VIGEIIPLWNTVKRGVSKVNQVKENRSFRTGEPLINREEMLESRVAHLFRHGQSTDLEILCHIRLVFA
jgi:hypothetical protein